MPIKAGQVEHYQILCQCVLYGKSNCFSYLTGLQAYISMTFWQLVLFKCILSTMLSFFSLRPRLDNPVYYPRQMISWGRESIPQ